jgi:predicted TIM-barrel fold metal-dependent hydrolase
LPIIDAGQYLIEPPDLWTARLPAQFREAAPRVVSQGDAAEAWSFENGAWIRPLTFGMAVRRPSHQGLPFGETYAAMRPGCYQPKARLEDMDLDGIQAAVLFPHFAQALGRLKDPELYLACVRAYNDGAREWADAGDPKRLFPVALVPALGVDAAVAELKRSIDRGFKSVLFCGWPNGGRDPQPEDGRFWGLCQEVGTVLAFHGPEPERQASIPAGWGAGDVLGQSPIEMVINSRASGLGAQLPVGRIVLRGILDEFPALKLCFAGTGAGWLPYFLEQIDGMYWHDRFYARFDFEMLPSEYLKRNTKATFHIDSSALQNREEIGLDNLLWQSLYPLETTDWPRSGALLDRTLGDLSPGERVRVTAINTAEYFGIPVPVGASA